MRPRLLVPVLTAALLVLPACGDDDGGGADIRQGRPAEPLTLTVVATDWNGWDPEHVATPETTSVDVELGAELEVRGAGSDPVVLTVSEVRDDAVEVTASEALATSDDGGLDLNDPVDDFEVGLDAPTELATATLDAGVGYVVTLAPTG
jgi:hypothetical protein